MIDIIKPDWPAPEQVHACTTTRCGGYSETPYHSLNLAIHVGDEVEDVETNRDLLAEALSLPNEPLWLEQVHGNKVICADAPPETRKADGSFAKTANKVCTIMSADCLPVLITNRNGSIVAALHAGWRGIAAGIIEQGIDICQRHDPQLMAWLGPAISPDHYEVGDEVRDMLTANLPNAAEAFKPSPNQRWLADLHLLATQRLQKVGVDEIYGSRYDTYTDYKRFFSRRRDGTTGRMATMIWFSPGIDN